MQTSPNIQLLMTGNELMIGQVADTNSALIAEWLVEHGYNIHRKVTVGDYLQQLSCEIDTLSQDADILIINGGLGPTSDDLTAQAVSHACGQPLAEHSTAKAELKQWCKQHNLPLDQANLKQITLPSSANRIINPLGTAPGFYLQHNDCLIIATSGVSKELRAMMKDAIIALIQQSYPESSPTHIVRIQTYGIAESTLQTLISKQLPTWPEAIKIGFRVHYPLLEVKLSVTGDQHLPLLAPWQNQLQALIASEWIGQDQTTLAGRVIELLIQHGKTLTTAESCTGGLIASMLTTEPGTSAIFSMGFVTYSNHAKQTVLGVDVTILAREGAVSRDAVLAMANGALANSGADYAIAVSGIAGPTGGSPSKPVGTVWIAWGQAKHLHAHKVILTGSRRTIQKKAACVALDLIRREVADIKEKPRYFY